MVALQELAGRYPRWGFWKYHHTLRLAGKGWNHKRVWRLYCALQLNLRRRPRRRLPRRERRPAVPPTAPNQTWALDFLADRLITGRSFRVLTMLDEFSREAITVEIDTSLSSERVVRTLDQVAAWRGLPRSLRLDNGPEFTAPALAQWATDHQVELTFIQPGKPIQNPFIERFNRTFRTEVLDPELFGSLDHVVEMSHQWLEVYNHQRPHQSLGFVPPAHFKAQFDLAETSLFELSH